MYDSRVDTYEHIQKVQGHLQHMMNLLHLRSLFHDRSKLVSPEVEAFDELTPKLKELTYGSEAYAESLKALGPALAHHYEANSHHPEYYPDGIMGMNLIDICEMLCDWIAATQRKANGDILKSIEINQTRFGYTNELAQILKNTVEILRI